MTLNNKKKETKKFRTNALIVSGFLDCAVNKSQFNVVYAEISTMMQLAPPEIKNIRLYCLAFTKITLQSIRKDLDESTGNYKGTAAWKPQSDCSDKKITPEFVGVILAMIDNHHCK